MNNLDELAIITFITCDAILENFYEIKNFYRYYYKNIKKQVKKVINRLFAWASMRKNIKNNYRNKMINIKKIKLGKYK